MSASALYSVLLATATADAYALPYENMSPHRVRRYLRKRQYALLPWIHGGMVSDDTEHAVMTLQAYIASAGDVDAFRRALRWRLMAWTWTLPVGAGSATLKSGLKMSFGWRETGVWSAGNGGAMRAPVLAMLCQDVEQLAQWIHASTTLTHRDPKAEYASYALALLVYAERKHGDWHSDAILDFVFQHIQDDELIAKIKYGSIDTKRGITGYAYHTIPAVFQIWRQFRDAPLEALDFACECGGDTDTVCALLASVFGARGAGQMMFDGIAGKWCEPVLRPSFFQALAQQAEAVAQSGQAQTPIRFGGWQTCLRNMVFLGIVLAHGFRRLLPPWLNGL